MNTVIKFAIKVIRIRSLISEALLSINVASDNQQLNDNIKNSTMKSCNVIEHIAEAILGGFIKPNVLIQDLESAKCLLNLFSKELNHVRLNILTLNEIQVLIKEIREVN